MVDKLIFPHIYACMYFHLCATYFTLETENFTREELDPNLLRKFCDSVIG